MRSVRGFTLPELLVALVLLGLIGGVLSSLMLRHERLAAEETARASLQANLRAGMTLLSTDLHETTGTSAGGDFIQLASDSVTYRAMRGLGFACGLSGTRVEVRSNPYFGLRQPQPLRDSLLLFVDGDPTLALDDRWVPLPILGVAAGTGCGGGAALILDTA